MFGPDPNMRRLLGDEGFRRALRALENSCRPVAQPSPELENPNEILLREMIPFFAALSVVSKKAVSKQTLKTIWTTGTGKTWKALREFPDRLRHMAKEVEQLNTSLFLCPSRAIYATTPIANAAKIHFDRLPGILKTYANWLDVWIDKFPKSMEEHFGPGRLGHDWALLLLSYLTKMVTGKFQDALLSELLNSADHVLNPEHQGPRFQPQTLLDLRYRKKRKTRPT